MASFPGVEPVFVFHIYLRSPTSLHRPPERNTHNCKVLLNVQQLCKPSSSSVWSSLQLGIKAFCQNKVWGVSNTHLASAAAGRAGQRERYSSRGRCCRRHGNPGCPDDVAADTPNTAAVAWAHAPGSAALHIPPPSFSTLIHKNPVFFIHLFPLLPAHGTSRSILITRNS